MRANMSFLGRLPEEAISSSANKRPDLVLLDWIFGTREELALIIQKFRQVEGCKSTAIILVAPEITPQVLAFATDYAAYRVLAAESFEETCQTAIQSLLAELSKPSPLRNQLIRLEQARERGATGEADRIAMDLASQFPDDARALIETTNFNLRKDNLQAAKEYMDILRKKFPKDLRVVNLSARIHLKEGNFKEALNELEKADLLSPKNADRLQVFGDIYRTKNELNKAKSFYNEVLAIEPNSKDALTGIGHVKLSEGDINSALELFRSSSSEEELISIFNNSAVLAVKEQNFSRADELYQAALGAAGSNQLKARVAFNQGLAFYKSSQVEKATECFVRSYKLDPTFKKNVAALSALKPNIHSEMQLDALSADIPQDFTDNDEDFGSFAFHNEHASSFEDDDVALPIKPPSSPTIQPTPPVNNSAIAPGSAHKAKTPAPNNAGTGRIIQLGNKK